jgi:hypothetical protein
MGMVLLELFNEPRILHDKQTLEEGAETCIAINPDRIDPANERKLVYSTGQAMADDKLRDDQLGISADGLKLTRTVRIYQWTERRIAHRTPAGKRGHQTTYTYEHKQRWVDKPVDSGKFHSDSKTGQRPSNSGSLPVGQRSWHAKKVRLGTFKLSQGQVDKLKSDSLPITNAMFADLPKEWRDRLTLDPKGSLYLPAQPGGKAKEPHIGDVRITFSVAKPQAVTVMTRQVGDSFEPWQSSHGGNAIDELRHGTVSQDELFHVMETRNPTPSWGLRIFSTCMAALGLALAVQPLAASRGRRPIVSGLSLLLTLLALMLAPALVVLIHGVRWYFVAPAFSTLPLVIGGTTCLILLGAGCLALRGPRQVQE